MSYHRVDIKGPFGQKHIGDGTYRTFYNVTTFWSEHDVKRGGHEGLAYTRSDEDHKVLRWVSNDAVVPDDIIEATDWQYQDEHKAARNAETSKFIAEYKERMKDHVPSAEEQFEMRAAFGPGETVVNVITGKKYRT